MNKRGNVEDLFYLIAILFGLSIFFVIFYQVYHEIQVPLGENLNSTWAQADDVLEQGDDALAFFDVMFPLLLIGIIIWVLISAYFIHTYPFMFFVSLFVLIFVILLAVVFANVHEQAIRDNTTLADANAKFQITGWIINKLPYIVIGIAVLVFIVLYAKWNTMQGEVI